MDVTPLIRRDQKIIQSYKNGHFRVSSEAYNKSIIVTFDSVHDWDGQIEPQSFSILQNKTDILLIGLNEAAVFLSPQRRAEFKAMNIVVDVMDVGAACRTFNVLTAEGRRVAVALSSSR